MWVAKGEQIKTTHNPSYPCIIYIALLNESYFMTILRQYCNFFVANENIRFKIHSSSSVKCKWSYAISQMCKMFSRVFACLLSQIVCSPFIDLVPLPPTGQSLEVCQPSELTCCPVAVESSLSLQSRKQFDDALADRLEPLAQLMGGRRARFDGKLSVGCHLGMYRSQDFTEAEASAEACLPKPKLY